MVHDRKDKGNVPNLRFPEFAGEWKWHRLGEIANVYDGTHQTPNYVDKGVRFLSVEDISSKDIQPKYITEDAFNKDFKIKPQKDDILMTRITAGIIGETSIVKTNEPLAYYVSLALIRQTGQISPKYLSIYINSNHFKYELHKRIIHVAFPKKINLKDLGECKVSYPKLDEQEKIAYFLLLIDERIATQNKIIEQYKSLIKGLTHFALKGKQANFRLKDCVFCNSSALKESEFEGIDGLHPVYGATGIIAYSSQYTVDENSILVIKDGASVGRVQYITGKYSAIGTLNYLTAKSGFSLKYIYYLLRYFNFDKYKVGSSIPHIYFKDYGNELIYCSSIKEQNKIARMLSQVDKKIDLEQILLDTYFLQKQYLLKNMFI